MLSSIKKCLFVCFFSVFMQVICFSPAPHRSFFIVLKMFLTTSVRLWFLIFQDTICLDKNNGQAKLRCVPFCSYSLIHSPWLVMLLECQSCLIISIFSWTQFLGCSVSIRDQLKPFQWQKYKIFKGIHRTTMSGSNIISLTQGKHQLPTHNSVPTKLLIALNTCHSAT